MIREFRMTGPREPSVGAQLRILIPAYNESTRICGMLDEYCRRFEGVAVIVVIANACTDDTAAVVRRLMERYQNLQLMEINARIGKGGAIRAGLKTGGEPYVGFADADGSTPAEEFERLFGECVRREADGVIGSRWLPGAQVEPRQPFMRRFMSRSFNRMVRYLFAMPFVDTQCGAKIFKRDAVNQVLPSLEVADFAFDIDLLFRMARHGFNVLELPTRWADRAAGTKIRMWQTSLTMLKTVLRLRMQESWLWRLPFADLLARNSIIPVKGCTKILAIGDPDADGWASACLHSLESGGGVSVEWSSSLKKRGFALFCWYVFRSQRRYDAIVEVAGRFPSFIPAISAKQCFVIRPANGGALKPAAYRRVYGRAHIISFERHGVAAASPLFGSQTLDDVRPETVAKYIVEQIGAGGFYRAAFHWIDGAWGLHFNDLGSGSWTVKDLK